MYDMHCHILPEVDDGARSIEEAVNMAMMAKENGIKGIFATSHYIEGSGYKDSVYNRGVLNKLNTELINRDIDIKIYLGCEVYSTLNILKLLEKEQITTLNNSRYILIELPMHDVPIFIEAMIYNLKLKGITPIIAHPERNTKIIETPNILHGFIMKGALAQLNLPSILGMYGEAVKKTAEILIRHDMIHFVGTDAHRPSKRYFNISSALDILNSLIGKEKTLKITTTNPESIISGINIETEEPRLYRSKKKIENFFSKLIGK